MKVQRQKIFLTGGTGFFGKSILEMVRRGALPGYEFTILARHTADFTAAYPQLAALPQVRFLSGDVRDFAFPNERFDGIIHAAAPAVTTLAPGEMREIVLRGTERVLAFARQCGAAKMMFISSGAVYGKTPPGTGGVGEDVPCRPVTEYGIAKLEAEAMCCATGLDALLPRCFAFTGPHLERRAHFAIGNFIADALAHRTIVVKGDGTPLRSYLYADDLVTWLFAVWERGRSRTPYNLGSPEGVSILELARLVRDLLHPEGGIAVSGRDVPGAAANYVPDVSRIINELKVQVTVRLPEAIVKSAA